jgi:hypothetical protein
LPAGWETNNLLSNPEPATTTNAANGNDLGDLAETVAAPGTDPEDVYAIQIDYWNSITSGESVPQDNNGGNSTPGSIGYSTGNSCMLYYPGLNNSGGANQGQFEITYPASTSAPDPLQLQWGPTGAVPNSQLWNAFPLNGNPSYSLSNIDGAPTGFVSTFKGCSWDANSCTTGSQVVPAGGTAPILSDWNAFPEVLANITSIPTTWSIAYDSNYGNPDVLDYPAGTNPLHPVWDASYDIFFDKTGQTGVGQAPYTTTTARGQNDGLEIMVWMNSKNSYVDDVVNGVGVGGNTENYPVPNITGYAQPSGWPREQVWINNVVYDVWTSRLNNPYYGYTAASNPNAASEPNYTIVKGGAEPYTCPTLPVYNTTGTATNGTNANGYTCGTEWNVVSFVATQSDNSGTLTENRGPSMSMDAKVFTDYILGINDGLWQQVTPPFQTYPNNNRIGAVATGPNQTIGVLQCPASAMNNQQENPMANPSACLSQDWVLMSIEAGFESWESGNGLESKSFAAHVITQAASVQSGLTTNQGNTPGETVVNWGTPFEVVYPGCSSGTTPVTYSEPSAVSYLITGVNSLTGAAMTYPSSGTPQSMTPIPGTTAFEGEVPALYPMHSTTASPTTVAFTATCGSGPQSSTVTFWIDPSGQVFYSDGKTPVSGATVTLEYSPSDSATGPFEAVPNANYGLTSDIMDTVDNTRNPLVTALYGVYAWDVAPGYYEVTATKSGCGSVTSPVQHVTTTPITNLFLDLPCAPPPLPKLVTASVPSTPAALTAAAASSSQINLAWSAVPLPPNATSVTYTVYEVSPTATVIVSGITATNYQVTGLNPGTSYTFEVTAVDAGGASAKSASANATTQAGSGTCHVVYTVTNATPGVTNGLTVNINIQNTGKTAIYPWTLGWTFPGNQKITYAWNVSESQTGEKVSLSSIAPWESIPAGGTLTGAVGFNGTYTGANTNPTAFTLNGEACD